MSERRRAGSGEGRPLVGQCVCSSGPLPRGRLSLSTGGSAVCEPPPSVSTSSLLAHLRSFEAEWLHLGLMDAWEASVKPALPCASGGPPWNTGSATPGSRCRGHVLQVTSKGTSINHGKGGKTPTDGPDKPDCITTIHAEQWVTGLH